MLTLGTAFCCRRKSDGGGLGGLFSDGDGLMLPREPRDGKPRLLRLLPAG